MTIAQTARVAAATADIDMQAQAAPPALMKQRLCRASADRCV